EEAAARVEYADPAEVDPPAERQPIEDVWLDDIFLPGSRVSCNSRNASVWSIRPEVLPPVGRRALKQAFASNYQDKFENSTQPLVIPENARLSVWVRIDPDEKP